MSGEKSGGCLCGAVRYVARGEPVFSCLCHCKNCQKQAGTAWSMVIGFPLDAVEISGEVKTYVDQGESGHAVNRQFCPNCGSPVFTRADGSPGLLFIKAGTLDDTSTFKPTAEFYVKSRQAWLDPDKAEDRPTFLTMTN